MHALLTQLGMSLPVIQAPMAGVSTPAMAAAVTRAGGLGCLGIGAMTVGAARQAIREARALAEGAIGINVFCHRPATPDPARETAWLERLRPHFTAFGTSPPDSLREIYTSFLADEPMLAMLLEERPDVVSFHFGLPDPGWVDALKGRGIVLLASATNMEEAHAAQAIGVDAVVAQGIEAGGHRGVFDPDARDEGMGTLALTRLLVRELGIPVIAAGGIMDGQGIRAVLELGAIAAQMGTAFVGTRESAADHGYRAALAAAQGTILTRVISGRPARSLLSPFTRLGEGIDAAEIPAYPIAYDAGKALNAAARARGESGYGALWAGQGAALARHGLGCAELMAALAAELRDG